MNFADPGVWCWQVANVDYNRMKAIAEAGFRWVAIQIVSADQPVITGDYRDTISNARMLGLDVAGFGWLDGEPVAAAEAADSLLASWQLDGFIANGEKPISYTQENRQCPDCFGYSQTWVTRWQQLRGGSFGLPGFPLAFSSYADFSRADIHYAPWIQAGAVGMPQTYWNELDWATPAVGVRGALDVKQPWNGPPFGWPVDKIHPTWANYPSGTRAIPTPAEYAANQLQTSARGFNIYLGEHIKPGDFAAYKELIPSLTATGKEPLTELELPYTGPYYGPSHTKGPDKGQTAKALKRALHRLGIGSFPKPDVYYNRALEAAMANWQRTLPPPVTATGQYGKGSWEEMRRALAPDGTYAMDATARGWVQKEAG